MGSITVPAISDAMGYILDFVEHELQSLGCSEKTKAQINIALDEIFTNIISYAYPSNTGEVKISLKVEPDSKTLSICFTDSGIPYNPLATPDPDITLSAEERGIGGLGIFMVKKSMDKMLYEYSNGKNKLTLIKVIA